MAKRKGTISWNPVKTVVKEILRQYSPEAVKAEIIWDHVKTEMPDTQITKETIYGVLSHMNKEGEIQRVSTGWYQLPGKAYKVEEIPADPVWKMGYEEGYEEGLKRGHKEGYRDGRDSMPPAVDLEKMKEKMMQIFFEELHETFLDKLVLEAQKVHPDPRRLLLIVEMMKEITGGRRGANS